MVPKREYCKAKESNVDKRQGRSPHIRKLDGKGQSRFMSMSISRLAFANGQMWSSLDGPDNGFRFWTFLNRVLVEKILPPSKTTAGILLPEKSTKLNSGKVVAVGPGTRDKEGKTIPVPFKEGDTVLLPEFGGSQVKLGDKEFHLYRDEDILGNLHD
ncbi:10 kDa chaperonin, mitochondrial-like [Hibiscus syriacus]|uniref:10 kDa chaperonin, mitochondrial-like n=1 Tax=Hibiscus syriacus TaxID=106335 RepID=UPI001922EEBC|nr:10 kDa chaperonin, mitochondrial-like [Hibiscus syriacus]